MLSSVNQVKSEVLYEKVFNIMRMYRDYLNHVDEPMDGIKAAYEEICSYPDKVLLCSNDFQFAILEMIIRAYEVRIQTVSHSDQVIA